MTFVPFAMKQHENSQEAHQWSRLKNQTKQNAKGHNFESNERPLLGKHKIFEKKEQQNAPMKCQNPCKEDKKKWTKKRLVQKPNNNKTLKKCEMLNNKITRAKLSDQNFHPFVEHYARNCQ